MKKTLKIVLLAAVMLLAVLTLTGCGNKLVATREVEATETTPKFKEETVVTFKKDKVNNIKMTFTFEDKDAAKKYVDEFNAMIQLAKAFAEDGELNFPELKQSGKKAIMNLDAKTYAELVGDSEEANMTKDEIKTTLEEQGYKVK